MTEPVSIRPTKQGVEYSPDRGEEYMTKEELGTKKQDEGDQVDSTNVAESSKPNFKLDWVPGKELGKLSSDISNAKKEEQEGIRKRYIELLKIAECLWKMK